MSSSVIVFQASICSERRLHYFRQIVSMPSSRVAPSKRFGAIAKLKWATKAIKRPTLQHNQTGIVGAAANHMIYGRRHSEIQALKHQHFSFKEAIKNGVFTPDSRLKAKWDTVILFCVISLAFVVPFQAAFRVGSAGLLYVLAVVMDFLFLIDIAFSFRTGFVENGVYCVSKERIASKYMSSWFPIDLVASAPLSLLPDDLTDNNSWLRFLKLFRLLRLTRLSRILSVWERNMVMHPGVLRLFKLFSLVILVAHWTACAWVMRDLIGFGETIWVPSLAYKYDLSLPEQYMQAPYWAFVALFTFSTEDEKPQLPSEAAVTIIIFIVGIYMNATIIGSTSPPRISRQHKARAAGDAAASIFVHEK